MNIRVLFIVLTLFSLPYLLIAQSCEVNGKRHFNFDDIKQVLDKNKCNQCHNSNNSNTWHYNDYESIFSSSYCNEAIIVPGSPNKSLLIDKLNGGPTACGIAMPLSNDKLSGQDLSAIEAWIEVGAPKNCIPEYIDIKNILVENKCNACHNSFDNWDFSSYTDIFNKPSTSICNDEIIKMFDARSSILYQKIAAKQTCGEIMPPDNMRMNDVEITKIRDWINAGAPESASILPVTLTDFNISKSTVDERIILIWQTASELNTNQFAIEYSKDGIEFTAAGMVDAIGSGANTYHFEIEKTAIGYHYFRLKIIDFDTRYSYSPIRVIKIENEGEQFSFSPNPIINGGTLTTEWYAADKRPRTKLLLVHINGQIQAEYIINNGINYIPLNGVLPGVYYLSIEDYNYGKIIKKLVVSE
ncbi:MAG TPA: hypothetical protein PLO48_09095 [Saprospiraceae bacterium]|nr:hypothetical protein [Saprospiraceae bacterium]